MRKDTAPPNKIFFSKKSALAGAGGLYLLEEVVAFVINKDECGEVNNLDFPDSLHTEFGILKALYFLDAVLRQDCCRATYTAKVEASVFVAGIGNLLAAITLGNHYHRAAVGLEEVNIRVHTTGCCRAK